MKKIKQLKKSLDLMLNHFEGYKEDGFSLTINGDSLLHHKVNESKYCKEWLLPQKNNWETTYGMDDGDWIVEIQHLTQNQFIEVYELFSEYFIYPFHSHTIIEELLYELNEMYMDDNINIIKWIEFLKSYVENDFQMDYNILNSIQTT